jgi:hypothetical protein
LTANTYGKWLPLGNKAAVGRLDATICDESGGKMVAEGVLEETEHSEVIGKFGGPCRGRTYGPLIKSLVEDQSHNTLQEELSANSEDSR